jgi:polyisoprenoid-binding protein YceI
MKPIPAALLLLLAAGAARGESRRYELDPVHTRIAFACKHLRFSNALGSFAHPAGTLWFDEKDWSSAKVDVRIDVATLDLGDAGWRERMLKRDFFNIDKFPQARFVSTSVEGIDATHARVTGKLTLRGKTAPVTLEVTLNDVGRHPYTFKNTAGFSARTTIRRSDFGMITLPNVVSDKVELRIEAEAIRSKEPGEE